MTRSLAELKTDVAKNVRNFADFPKKGILFRDIMPLIQNSKLLNELCHAIANHVKEDLGGAVDAVAGLEARGFLFGPSVAILLDVPFIPIRKLGKLPGKTIKATYVKEYGEDIVEIQADALQPGARVLILDDLLATGGTMRAAIDLIEGAGGKVAEAFVLIELADLKGRDCLPQHIQLFSLISYAD